MANNNLKCSPGVPELSWLSIAFATVQWPPSSSSYTNKVGGQDQSAGSALRSLATVQWPPSGSSYAR